MLALGIIAIVFSFSLFFAIFKFSAKSSLKPSQKALPSFPLGSLGSWVDLLKLNKELKSENKGVLSQWIFSREAFAVVSAENVRKILQSSTSREMSPVVLNFFGLFHIKRFMGNRSVGVAEGQEWSHHRKAIGKSLKPIYLRGLVPMMESCVAEVEAHIDDLIIRNGGVGDTVDVDIEPFMHALTLDIVCTTVFRKRLGALKAMRDGTDEPAVAAFRLASDEMVRRLSSTNVLDWLYGIGQMRKKQAKLNQAYAIIRNRVQQVIADARRTAQSDDTTAAALSFALHELSKDMASQQRLRDEINAAYEANGENSPLDTSIIAKLRFLNAVCTETLRLHPPALWTNRGLVKDVELEADDGSTVHLKRGTCAFIPIWAVHRSKINWPDRPDEFVPDRFMEPGSDATWALVPFGGGNRICPGHRLAPQEFKIALVRLVRSFEFSVVPGSPPPVIKAHGMFQMCERNVLRIRRAPSL